MSFRPEHEIHRRRLGRNIGVGVLLGAFVVLMFALSIVKVTQGDLMHGNGKAQAGTALPQTEASQGAAP
ncbi:cytochrome C oxidase assembly protein [Fuscibacter oryzae]|uniref:Cytochrome C oxidase assembly protein n=1 Tax=Fuscibacter oryzae TaxID=2803939 RepID=A0A8J7SUU5_9RHOB|nr:cytochrome C oxidase assembly protein [Fuscibacter oryzae]MBL4929975.1 cytochrome C oxidase assembly protein [Fuscibacter oryzae]